VSITKVVVLFTRNPTKFSLQFSEFSTICYTFYKFLKTRYTFEDSFRTEAPGKNQTLADRSLVHGFNPGKISIVINLPFRRRVGSPAAMAGRPWPTSGAVLPRGSPRADWRGWTARPGQRRGCAVAPTGSGRWSTCSGEVAARVGRGTGQGCQVTAREAAK
jgi:hypothetical protein